MNRSDNDNDNAVISIEQSLSVFNPLMTDLNPVSAGSLEWSQLPYNPFARA